MKNRKNNNLATVLFACLALALVMTACMNASTTDTAPAGTPGPAPSMAPSATVANRDPFDWNVHASEIEENLRRISEISEARVVVDGSTALVAVKFAPAYKGEMTPRIREMVAGEIMKADPEIKTVAVTADEADVTRAYDLSERLRAGEVIDNLRNDIEEIVRNITTRT